MPQFSKPEVVCQLEAAGLTLQALDWNTLKVTPSSAVTPEHRAAIKRSKSLILDWLASLMEPEPFAEPPGFEGTGWRVSGASGARAETLARFYAASLALDRGGLQYEPPTM